jgi:ADP-heptose:LPS heptosyltransferase
MLKRIELAWRRFWIRVLVLLMRRPNEPHPDWNARPHRVLFLRHDRAGDMILSTGVMRAITRSHPKIQLDVLASPVNASVLAAADYVHDVIVFDKKRLAGYIPTARRLRRARYDAVIDCMVTAPSLTTLLLIFASGARHRIGIAGRGNDAAFTIRVPADTRDDAHMVDRLSRLLTAFDVDPSRADVHPILAFTAAERSRADRIWDAGSADGGAGPRVLINVSAGTSERHWDDANYVAIVRHVRAREPSARFRVIASPAEAHRAEHVARDGGGVAVRTPSLRDALALVATADFVFTPDTSIAHAATALRRNGVAIYGKGSATRWGLYGVPTERSVEHTDRTLGALPVERVARAIDDAWAPELNAVRRG